MPRHERSAKLDVHRVLPMTRLPTSGTDLVATALAVRRMGGPWDVALAHSSTTALGVISARLGIPVVRVYHASSVRELRFRRDHLRPGLERWANLLLEPFLGATDALSLPRSRRILVLSEFSRGLIAEDHSSVLERTVNVGGGVDTDAFSPGDGQAAARARLGVDGDQRLLLTVRRFDERMGIDLLLEAMSSIRMREAVLAIVGSGALEKRFKQLTAQLGIEHRVRFLGAVPDEELKDWYRAADCFVLPTVAYEGFGMVTAEALASGTPVIGTPIGATPELLLPLDERLVTAGTRVDDLVEAIVTLFDHLGPELRARSRRYAVEHLSWSRAIGAWEAVLEEVAAGG